MPDHQRARQLLLVERLLAQPAPVDGPLPQERAVEVEGGAKVGQGRGGGVEEGSREGELGEEEEGEGGEGGERAEGGPEEVEEGGEVEEKVHLD